MGNATFNGVDQLLYFMDNHPAPGQSKGMAQILTERGYDTSRKKAQCAPKFLTVQRVPQGAAVEGCCTISQTLWQLNLILKSLPKHMVSK